MKPTYSDAGKLAWYEGAGRGYGRDLCQIRRGL